MNILDEIKRRFFRAGQIILDNRATPAFGGFGMCAHNFADLIWYNICDLLTDLAEDVKVENDAPARGRTEI